MPMFDKSTRKALAYLVAVVFLGIAYAVSWPFRMMGRGIKRLGLLTGLWGK